MLLRFDQIGRYSTVQQNRVRYLKQIICCGQSAEYLRKRKNGEERREWRWKERRGNERRMVMRKKEDKERRGEKKRRNERSEKIRWSLHCFIVTRMKLELWRITKQQIKPHKIVRACISLPYILIVFLLFLIRDGVCACVFLCECVRVSIYVVWVSIHICVCMLRFMSLSFPFSRSIPLYPLSPGKWGMECASKTQCWSSN